jgi:DNA-binding MarR family transcriptional regulator
MPIETASAQPGDDTPSDDAQGAAAHRASILKKLRIVIRSAQRHSSWIEKKCGVNGAQLWIIHELHATPGMRVGEIAERLAIHQTTASNLLDELQKKKLVIKTRDANDQRVVRLTLSDSGSVLLAGAPKPARGLLPGALLKMNGSALQKLDAGLQGLLDSVGLIDEESGMLPLPFTM